MTFTRLLHIYLSLSIIGVVLYGLAGPLLDHHFAERIPYHGHVYLSGQPGTHAHPYDRLHTHDGAFPGSNDILFVPDQTAQQASDSFAGWQWLTSSPWLTLAPILLTLFLGWGTQQRLQSIFLSPPDKPPRLFA